MRDRLQALGAAGEPFAHLEKMMRPIQERRAYYEGREDDLMQILESGASRARSVAEKTMEDVYRVMGLLH